jgi:cell division septation protein DedD
VGETVLTVPDAETRIWAVQVASFKDVDRALKLRDELRELGYEAFLSTLKLGDERLNRVAVGPLLSESDAQALQQTLSEELEQQAALMAFSN